MRSSVHFMQVAGIPVRLHWSFLLAVPPVAAATAVHLVGPVRTARVLGLRTLLPLGAWAPVMALALVGAVLLPEVVHALASRAVGVRVRSIALVALGGATESDGPATRSLTRLGLALLSPATSFALAAIAFAASNVAGAVWPGDASAALTTIARLHLGVGVLALLPAAPFKGAELLRAALVSARGRGPGELAALRAGEATSLALAACGLASHQPVPILAGLVIWVSTRGPARAVAVRRLARGRSVRELARFGTHAVDGRDPVGAALQRMARTGSPAVMVIAPEGRTGLLLADEATRVPPAERGVRRAGDWARFDVPTIDAEDDLEVALDCFATNALAALPVRRAGVVDGILWAHELPARLGLVASAH